MPTRLPALRYFRLAWSMARYCLIRELGFRFNFIARCLAGVAWLSVLVLFFQMIFLSTNRIGEWDRHEYLFFLGTGFLLNAVLDTVFLSNCTHFAELIRTGDLDFALTKPIDEQFLVSFQRVDWSEVPSIFVGIGLLVSACVATGTPITLERTMGYSLLLLAGIAIMYSLMLMMAASSVWIVRNQGLYEMWFYVTQFARYPADIYRGNWLGVSLRFVLMFMVPVLLAVNVPARYGVKIVSWPMVMYLMFAAAAMLAASRWFFRYALRAYRSASS